MGENLALTESTYYILLSLVTPQHGYGIMLRTEELSNGRVHLAAGTLYGALNAMVEKGWIEMLKEDPENRRKDYRLTECGKKVLANEITRLCELAENGRKVIMGEM